MEEEIRKPRPGWISGADDMLGDFDEIDRRDEGVLTPAKVDAMKRYAAAGSPFNTPAYLAGNFGVSITEARRFLNEYAE